MWKYIFEVRKESDFWIWIDKRRLAQRNLRYRRFQNYADEPAVQDLPVNDKKSLKWIFQLVWYPKLLSKYSAPSVSKVSVKVCSTSRDIDVHGDHRDYVSQ